MATKKNASEVTKMELKKRAIAACKDSKGRVTPDAVIHAAKVPTSVLHGEFEWDVNKAAYHSWTETAQRLIREVKLVITYQDVRIVAPYYVTDSGSDESAYVETSKIANKHAAAKVTLADELARIKGAIQRGRTLAAVFGLVSNFDRMLDLAIEAERLFESSGGDEDAFQQVAT